MLEDFVPGHIKATHFEVGIQNRNEVRPPLIFVSKRIPYLMRVRTNDDSERNGNKIAKLSAREQLGGNVRFG